MCLEFLNQFLSSGLAWVALGAFAGLLAALAAVSLFASPRGPSAHRQDGSFTCPCYTPPDGPTPDDLNKPDSA